MENSSSWPQSDSFHVSSFPRETHQQATWHCQVHSSSGPTVPLPISSNWQGKQSSALQTPPFLSLLHLPSASFVTHDILTRHQENHERNSSKEVVRPQGVKMLPLVKTFFPLKLRVSCFREPGPKLPSAHRQEKQPLHYTGGTAMTAHTLLCQDTLTNICSRFLERLSQAQHWHETGGGHTCLREAEPLKTRSLTPRCLRCLPC